MMSLACAATPGCSFPTVTNRRSLNGFVARTGLINHDCQMAVSSRLNGQGRARRAPKPNTRLRGRTNGKPSSPSPAALKTNGAPPSTSLRVAYDAFKEFEGKRYTGVKVGRGHRWLYQTGEWVEKKITPDRWEFRYTVPKRRKGRAPEGSGVPAGTAYHWYILAHQTVEKLDANNYDTDMVGMKYKLSHRRADKPGWSASEKAQRRRLIQILKETIAQLEQEVASPR